jgi:hypothetical protein
MGCHDDIDFHLEEIGHKDGGPFILPLQVSSLNTEISSRDVALIAKALKKGVPDPHASRTRWGHEPDVADLWNLRPLLGLGGERRGEEHRTRASNERAAVDHWVSRVGFVGRWKGR